jgi:lipopolysaccharide transport system ATP-binding protein
MKSKDIAIKVDNISKYYRIGLKEEMNENFAGSVLSFIKRPLTNFRKYRALYKFDELSSDLDASSEANTSDLFVALRNISFEVKKGEVVGIIGKNGAGKSTLLKILSRITYPTSGKVELRGRNSSLLEVGTGFHPELTGRENVYLNGTILGMTKKEVDRKFDSIVDFSGISKFIDTPVKRYSSGMSVRLAFSVAAHLEPEILIIDEVLAVGDVGFQAKCIGKMNSIAHEGRTVLFVSHNMGAVIDLCQRVVWLEGGRIKLDGSPRDVITEYLSVGGETTGCWTNNLDEDCVSKTAYLTHAALVSEEGNGNSNIFQFVERIAVEIGYRVMSSISSFICYVLLKDSFGNILWASRDAPGREQVGQVREPGIYKSTCTFPGGLLRPGQYFVTIGIYGKHPEIIEEEYIDALSFRISQVGFPFNSVPKRGLLTPDLPWVVGRQPLECE